MVETSHQTYDVKFGGLHLMGAECDCFQCGQTFSLYDGTVSIFT